jgi:hypothetical protein
MTTYGILLGSDSHHTCFGRLGCSRGASYGSYDNYYYGIKYLFAICVYKGWGDFSKPHRQWPHLYNPEK